MLYRQIATSSTFISIERFNSGLAIFFHVLDDIFSIGRTVVDVPREVTIHSCRSMGHFKVVSPSSTKHIVKLSQKSTLTKMSNIFTPEKKKTFGGIEINRRCEGLMEVWEGKFTRSILSQIT